jgi:hypothetical protein
MRTSTKRQPTIDLHEVKTQGRRIHLRAELTVELPLPAQDEHLPATLARAVDDAGQRLKRLLFQQALEQADTQLVLRQLRGRNGQRLCRRGSAKATFKTVFGTVHVRRSRLENTATTATHLPAAKAWQTPQQVCITAGLRHAAADALLSQSATNALDSVQASAGESDLLGKAELLKIVHHEGQALRQAAAQRALAALSEQPPAKELLLPPVSPAEPAELAEAAEAEASAVVEEEPAEAAALPLGFPGNKVTAAAVAAQTPRKVDDGWVVVQPDGVNTPAQARTRQKRLETYTAVVLLAWLSWQFAAASPHELIVEVAALLATRGVAEGKRKLLFLADGARWIRVWFEGLKVKDKAMLLCWYHLVKRAQQLLSLGCRGRQHRLEVEVPVLHHLWHGRLDEALKRLREACAQMKKAEALNELVGYLEERRRYLVDYAGRKEAGLWIASNRRGEVQRPGHLGAVQAPGDGLDARRSRSPGSSAGGQPQ